MVLWRQGRPTRRGRPPSDDRKRRKSTAEWIGEDGRAFVQRPSAEHERRGHLGAPTARFGRSFSRSRTSSCPGGRPDGDVRRGAGARNGGGRREVEPLVHVEAEGSVRVAGSLEQVWAAAYWRRSDRHTRRQNLHAGPRTAFGPGMLRCQARLPKEVLEPHRPLPVRELRQSVDELFPVDAVSAAAAPRSLTAPGERLGLRLRSDLSVYQVADACSVTEATFRAWESGATTSRGHNADVYRHRWRDCAPGSPRLPRPRIRPPPHRTGPPWAASTGRFLPGPTPTSRAGAVGTPPSGTVSTSAPPPRRARSSQGHRTRRLRPSHVWATTTPARKAPLTTCW